ncbi:MAG: nucleotidyltransferase substrate binding protein [Firmicutes bacterium]|nr:nucleotidyltransferase substrate binding protein [Bacillota bacterium]
MLRLNSLIGAVKSLEVAVDLFLNVEKYISTDENLKNVVRAGVIQNFEVAYELSWKFVKRYLEAQVGSGYIDGIHRKELFRIAAEHHLIDDVESWFDYNKARNLTSHVYREEYADEVAEKAAAFLCDAKKLIEALEKHND